MPNRATHVPVGLSAAVVTCLWTAREQEPEKLFIEFLGSLVGGYAGARLPDLIDPATSPNHRSIAHGFLTAGGSTIFSARQLESWQGKLRRMADEAKANNDVLLELALRFASGLLAGLVGGVASHLLLDSMTPKGLPLVA